MTQPVKTDLRKIHPTQVTAGLLEVDEKRKHYASLSGNELKDAVKAVPIPVVVGPKGANFAIDHHHLARALSDAKIEYAYVEVMANLSKFEGDAFWLQMAARRWVHPYDEHGILHGVAAIPNEMSGLIDDPFRSLSAFVRNGGGYDKTPEPFAEFQWADFFRTRVRLWTTPSQFDAAVAQGIHLAKSPDALVLPGFISQQKGKNTKTPAKSRASP